MNFFRSRIIIFSLFFFFISSALSAAIVQINGKWSDNKYAPTLSVPEHYDLGVQLLHENKWGDALQNFMIIALHFPESPFYADALFSSGICYYFLSEFDFANKQFTRYLNLGGNLKHFDKVFEFKYHIADFYSKGSKKHLLGFKQLPAFLSAKSDALDLYDEVIASVPSREIAALSLYGKGDLLRKRRQYKESIEALQILTRRFPKHSLAADAFVLISDIYYEESEIEAQNPDLLALAQINFTRFQKSFPGDERTAASERNLVKMQEAFAHSLYETGRFYEKKKKPQASRIYYGEAIKRYPSTSFANKSRSRLAELDKISSNRKEIAQK